MSGGLRGSFIKCTENCLVLIKTVKDIHHDCLVNSSIGLSMGLLILAVISLVINYLYHD